MSEVNNIRNDLMTVVEELKRISDKYHIPIVTAHQSSLESEDDIGMICMGDIPTMEQILENCKGFNPGESFIIGEHIHPLEKKLRPIHNISSPIIRQLKEYANQNIEYQTKGV